MCGARSARRGKAGEIHAREAKRRRSGGLYGATLSVSATNLARLCHLSGPALPLAPVSVPPGTSVGYSIVYDGLEASESQGDIALTATVTENMTGMASSNECSATSVRLELAAVWEAPENPCTNRHVYGVGEKVLFKVRPQLSSVMLSTTKYDTGEPGGGEYELFEGQASIDAGADRVYRCPISKNFEPFFGFFGAEC